MVSAPGSVRPVRVQDDLEALFGASSALSGGPGSCASDEMSRAPIPMN